MERLFELIAMSLDTLPQGGRILLLALLLSLAFVGFTRVLSPKYGENMHILYRKAALMALIVVPFLVWLTDVRMTVYVEEVRYFATDVPHYTTIALLVVWIVGVIVQVYRLGKRVGATVAHMPEGDAPEKLLKRLQHWQSRLNFKANIQLRANGGDYPWHTNDMVVLPAAALNWPVGVVDAMLLLQLAQLKNRCWYWVLTSEFVACVFWFAPWVAKLAEQLRALLPHPAVGLARAAYRDPEGWRRDFRALKQRADTLSPVGGADDSLLRMDLGLDTDDPRNVIEDAGPRITDPITHEERWEQTRQKRWQKHFDPYERVYWLVASASLAVAIFTTLTIERSPPEFEPRFLEIKWQDRMEPRLRSIE